MNRSTAVTLIGSMALLRSVVFAQDVPASWTTSRSEGGVIVYTIESEYQSKPTELLVLLPDDVQADAQYSVLFVLPVEAGSRRAVGGRPCRDPTARPAQQASG